MNILHKVNVHCGSIVGNITTMKVETVCLSFRILNDSWGNFIWLYCN